jgi:hypothetical protein
VINPAELVDNLVALLREHPELVAEMDGDEQRIFAYHDQYPKTGEPRGGNPRDAGAGHHGRLAGHDTGQLRRRGRLAAPGHALSAGARDLRWATRRRPTTGCSG